MEQLIGIVKENLDLNTSKTLNEAVYEAFRKSIVLGLIPAGTRINEKECATLLNLSRTPIRYAMSQLKNEDLVTRVPKKGIIVKGISIRDALEIFEIRKWLDTLAAIKAMERMSDDDFEKMRSLIDEAHHYDEIEDIEKVIDNFKQFNNFIYEKSEMIRLTAIVNELQAYLKYFREISLLSDARRKEAIAEHEMIYRGMRNKDINQITLITHEHLAHSQQFVISEMEKNHIA
ncbi:MULTISPECIES: GntR family transcriptional regulator [unclassified Facklamia]|uniref:GntR family transcriptional regulator n=1 Tax=Aerococcaceae TaxID=186827 RepID=UPI0013B5AFA8|nr:MULTISPECIES: GntR family transcriptional regulator [unclassified Facklamia]MBS4462388.1 GntR family transcriptional regulator [Aerococcaceae bacterium zg-B36]NEW64900.1 FCD domain-containing protein [Facklamia sp. 252]NEW68222.1 FCD domain-containing protein [Facklamia sp. 253]QQD66065.1 GntR family transcriptional regulator [Aerococcaceae bacterium zg-252]